jgi:hypothetical protein
LAPLDFPRGPDCMAVPSQQGPRPHLGSRLCLAAAPSRIPGLATLVSLSRVYLGAHDQDLHVWGCGVANNEWAVRLETDLR